MTQPPMAMKLMAASLSLLLLLACGTTRHSVSAPPSTRELGRYALILERGPDGQVTHAWRPVKELGLAAHTSLPASQGGRGRIVPASFSRDCEEEQVACESMCLAGLKGDDWSHASAGSKRAHCRGKCMPAYRDCSRLKEMEEGQTVKFQAVDEAVTWVKQNHEALLVGTLVVIAGVTFAVAVAGSGGVVLLLVPVAFLASSATVAEPRALAVKP